MLTFEVNEKAELKYNRDLINQITRIFYKQAGLKGGWDFSLALVDGKAIRRLNRIYRGKDKVTDVLSFEEEKDAFPGVKNFLGEIIICPSRLRRQAREYKVSVDQEFSRLLVHGLSHLLGYDHENVTLKKRQEMERFEENILSKIKFNK